MLLPLLLLAPALAPAQELSPARGIQLPASTAADALAGIAQDTAPVALVAAPWPAWEEPDWDGPAPWRRWVELAVEESRAPRPDAGRRSELALLAAAQGRHLDAWEHFALTGAEPAVAAAVLPQLFPGVPASAAAAPGGMAAPLPDGVLLRPLLPPLDRATPHGRPHIREAHIQGLTIGEAVVDLELNVEADGVELTFTHRSGGAARVRVILPMPPDREIRTLYVDWVRLEELPAVIELDLVPGEASEAAIWGRFDPAAITWPPLPRPGQLPQLLERGGLLFEVDAGDPLEARLPHLARGLSDLLQLPASVARRGESQPKAGATAPIRIAFPASQTPRARSSKLAYLISAAEGLALGPRR